MRIVFMGTPEFAVPCLDRIEADGHDLCAVFTRPDKPSGRGQCVKASPVKEWAVRRGAQIFQPATLKDDGIFETIRNLRPDAIVVAAYGRILPERVLSIPRFGCINVHASLLPRYRGAGPIQWCVINGEKETGITTMYMAKGIDTGDMILREATPIGENETYGELHDRLSRMGAPLLSKTLALAERGEAPREKQDDSLACYAPMIDKSVSGIDWCKPAAAVHNLVRGLNPRPCAVAGLNGKSLRILRTVKGGESDARPGEITGLSKDGITVCCGDGRTLILTEVQLQGKRRMTAGEYLCGHPAGTGDRFARADI